MNATNEPMDVENGRMATLPVEILLNIFAKTNAMDLLNLSGMCRRFEVIASIALQNKYGTNDWSLAISMDSNAVLKDACNQFQHIEHLHVFQFSDGTGVFDVFFELLQKYRELHTVSYHIDRNTHHMPIERELYGRFLQVIRIIDKPDAKIEVKCDDEIMIAMSKNEVAWMDGCFWKHAE